MNEDFDSFFTRTYSRTMAKALLLDGHRQDDEDAVAEAYAIVAAKWDVVSEYEAPEAYLHVTMRRLVWRAIKCRKRRAEQPIPEHLDLPTPAVEGVAEIFAALAELTPTQRAVVVLCQLEGHEQKAVAKMLGIARGTVATHLHDARRRLERTLVPARHDFPNGVPLHTIDRLRPNLVRAATALAQAIPVDHDRLIAKIAAAIPQQRGRR